MYSTFYYCILTELCTSVEQLKDQLFSSFSPFWKQPGRNASDDYAVAATGAPILHEKSNTDEEMMI